MDELRHCIKKACTIVRTDAGLSDSFEVKFGLHQGSVLSPLLFAAVMDVVSSEARSGLPSELLYADDLVIMAPKWSSLVDGVIFALFYCLLDLRSGDCDVVSLYVLCCPVNGTDCFVCCVFGETIRNIYGCVLFCC